MMNNQLQAFGAMFGDVANAGVFVDEAICYLWDHRYIPPQLATVNVGDRKVPMSITLAGPRHPIVANMPADPMEDEAEAAKRTQEERERRMCERLAVRVLGWSWSELMPCTKENAAAFFAHFPVFRGQVFGFLVSDGSFLKRPAHGFSPSPPTTSSPSALAAPGASEAS
jgi:hypothetical protein